MKHKGNVIVRMALVAASYCFSCCGNDATAAAQQQQVISADEAATSSDSPKPLHPSTPNASPISTDPLSTETAPSQGCHSPFHGMHVSLRHNENRGVGYRDGYTTLEGFGIYKHCLALMPFLDLRGHLFNDAKLAGNVGIGARSLLSSINHFLGYYVYYDVRQDRHHLTPQQVSPGIELLGKRMEYRVNGYFPVGNRKSRLYDFKFDSFKGHRIFLKDKQRYAMSGGDAEVGVHLTQSTKGDFYAGVGPYYFSSPHASSWGGKARLLGRFKEYISLEASYTYDHLFGGIFQGNAAITLPFGKKLKEKNCTPKNNLVLSRAVFSPYRFEIPVVKKITKKEKAINPATGAPWNVWFVNNTSSSNGTFESPFPTLLQAQNASGPNDVIYVFAGDGTTKGMDQGIVLQNAQKLFGSGMAQFINTTRGGITIPAFSSTAPMIANTLPASNVVTLSNGNEVSGIDLHALVPGVSAIFGSGVQGGMFHDNLTTGAMDFGIVVLGTGDFVVANNQLSYGTFNGITMHSNSSMNCTISNNVLNGISGASQGILVQTAPSANWNGTISNNTITNGLNGISLSADNLGSINCEITNNTINTMAGGSGIFLGNFFGLQGPIQANITNNQILMAGQGILLLETSSQPDCIRIENNQISNVSINGIGVVFSGASQNNFFVNNNKIDHVPFGAYGVNVTVNSPSSLCLQLLDNTVTNGAGYVLNNTGGTFELDAANNAGSFTEIGAITPVPPNSCTCNP